MGQAQVRGEEELDVDSLLRQEPAADHVIEKIAAVQAVFAEEQDRQSARRLGEVGPRDQREHVGKAGSLRGQESPLLLEQILRAPAGGSDPAPPRDSILPRYWTPEFEVELHLLRKSFQRCFQTHIYPTLSNIFFLSPSLAPTRVPPFCGSRKERTESCTPFFGPDRCFSGGALWPPD